MTKAVFVLLIVLVSVIPNSLKELAAVLLVVAAVQGLLVHRAGEFRASVWGWWIATTAVTIYYTVVGKAFGASDEAAQQALIIYVASPALWMLVFAGAYRRWGEEFVARVIVISIVLSCATVPVFLYLFSAGGASAVTFFIDNGNVNIGDGYAGATMHVFGSMIFLFGGLAANWRLFKGNKFGYGLIICAALVVLMSGRVALVVSIGVGVGVGILLSGSAARLLKSLFVWIPLVIGAVTMSAAVLFAAYGVDMGVVMSIASEHIMSFGGIERQQQMYSLLEWASRSYFLGQGHGLGTDYIRNVYYPWRYELVWLALILKVGVVGFAAYAGVFVVTLRRGARMASSKSATDLDKFMMGGLASALVASFTNPYIEAVMMQWMYVLPVVHFSMKAERTVAWLRRTNISFAPSRSVRRDL